MKTVFLYLTVLIFSIVSCKKTDDAVLSIPTSLPDTLGVGWSKSTINSKTTFLDIGFNGINIYAAVDNSIYQSRDNGRNWDSINFGYAMNIFVTNNKLFISDIGGLFQKDHNSNIVSSHVSISGYGDIYFIDSSFGYFFSGSRLYKTLDEGNTWTATSISLPGNGSYNTLFFLNNNTGWLAYGNKIIKTDGITSMIPSIINEPPGEFQSIYAISADVIFAGSGGRIFKSLDGGSTFNKTTTLPTSGFTDIHFVDSMTGYVCSGNRIYKTVDSGNTWNKIVSLGDAYFYEIFFTDANHGWACGTNGTILKFVL